MEKKFLTLDEQIETLKSRGLIIKNVDEAKKVLCLENYYNVINAYKHKFIDKTCEEEKYVENTSFDEIYSLFLFDREVKNLFLKYILQIENNIKSVIAHDFSKKYGHENYLKISNFNTTIKPTEKRKTVSQKTGEIASLISNLHREISHQLNNNSPMISHYILNYGYVPFWVLVNTLSFGTVSLFYSYLKEKDQNDIGRIFNLKSDELTKILFILGIFRNACAHDERFYNLKSVKKDMKPNSIKDTIWHSKLNIAKNSSNNYVQGKNDLFSVTIIFKLLLSKEDYTSFAKSLNLIFHNTAEKINTVSIQEIQNEMGFPSNWIETIE